MLNQQNKIYYILDILRIYHIYITRAWNYNKCTFVSKTSIFYQNHMVCRSHIYSDLHVGKDADELCALGWRSLGFPSEDFAGMRLTERNHAAWIARECYSDITPRNVKECRGSDFNKRIARTTIANRANTFPLRFTG